MGCDQVHWQGGEGESGGIGVCVVLLDILSTGIDFLMIIYSLVREDVVLPSWNE